MPDNDVAKPLDDLIDGRTVVMLMTMIGQDHSSRPLTCLDVDGDRLSFLIDHTTEWATAIAAGTAVVHATVADERKNTYLALNGRAAVSRDRSTIDRLWNAFAGAYFDGKDDPNVAVLTFDVSDGEFWDGPNGRIGSAIALIRTAISHDPSKSGESGQVAVGGSTSST